MTGIRLKIFDDYSPDVDAIRQHAIQDTYYPPTINDWWLGFRSKMYSDKDDNVIGELCRRIVKDLDNQFYHGSKFKFDAYFHYCPLVSQQFAGPEVWESLRFHRDYKSNFAGLYFIAPNPTEYSGTSFVKDDMEHKVDNVFNRLIMFDSKILHGPQDFFGDDITNARLNLVFFSERVINLYGTV